MGFASSSPGGAAAGMRFPSMLTGPWSHLRSTPISNSDANTYAPGSGPNNSSSSVFGSPNNKTMHPPTTGDTTSFSAVEDSTGADTTTPDTHAQRSRCLAVDGIASAGSSVQDSEVDERSTATAAGLLPCTTSHASSVTTAGRYQNSPTSSPKRLFGNAANNSSSSSGSAQQASSPSSSGGGLLSTLASTRLHWSFPVVRAIHGVAAPSPSHGEITPSGLTAAISSSASSRSAAKTANRQMKQLEKRGQWVQQQIIDIDRCALTNLCSICFYEIFVS